MAACQPTMIVTAVGIILLLESETKLDFRFAQQFGTKFNKKSVAIISNSPMARSDLVWSKRSNCLALFVVVGTKSIRHQTPAGGNIIVEFLATAFECPGMENGIWRADGWVARWLLATVTPPLSQWPGL